MLAVVFALERWHQFTLLEPMTRKPLDRAPKRLQGMLLHTLAYNIAVKYLEGKKHFLADTLSRVFSSRRKKSHSK